MAKSVFTREMLVSPSGAELNLFSFSASGGAAGVIQVNHGLAEHAARYERFAKFMAPHGFHIYAHDHRGHGETTAADAPPGVFADKNGAAKIVADVGAIHQLIANRHPDLPVICFGHSMGGLIALNYALANSARIAGLACWNANFSAGLLGRIAKAILAWEQFRLGSDVPSRSLPKLTFRDWAAKIPDRKTDFDWLSRDEAEVAKYLADPLCGWNASVSMWQEILKLVFAGADDRNFGEMRRDLPVDLIGGEKDPATDGGKAILALNRRLSAMGFSDVTCNILGKTRHESLNEINRDEVMERFAKWAGNLVGNFHAQAKA